jgi:hypothetical protein
MNTPKPRAAVIPRADPILMGRKVKVLVSAVDVAAASAVEM